MKKWLPLAILGAAQFIMVLDSSVMNVSISQIVSDLNTTIEGVQGAITMYTLVMAAFMLVGARLGDIWGRSTAFALGLGVYGVGSLTTALSPNLSVLLVGWSLVEGLGAVLVIPAIAALIVTQYQGKDRALAYGLIGGAAGAAVATGPLIGGWVTTTFSWRWVFAGETVVVVAILLLRRRMAQAGKPEHPPKLDYVGAALSALGLGLIVFAVLKSSTWGWVEPVRPPEIGGHEITPLGFSPVLFLIVAGLGVLVGFAAWERRREEHGKDALLDRRLLRIKRLRAGLGTLTVQQLVLMGTFFVLPVFLQVVLGLDAFDTGKRLFPMSIAMLIAALGGPRLAARWSPKLVAQGGLIAIVIAAVLLVGTVDVELNGPAFAIALAIFGVGAGLMISQLGNVIMSSVPQEQSNEAGGLQGTAQNLGASLGTALIGAILITSLTANFVATIDGNNKIPNKDQQAIIATANESGLDVVPVSTVESVAKEAGLSSAEAKAVADSYGNALLKALKRSLFAVALFALFGLAVTRDLPGRAPAPEPEVAPAPAVPAPTAR
jgi:EmrB/QacA subfamily drug resistance transporter